MQIYRPFIQAKRTGRVSCRAWLGATLLIELKAQIL